MSTSRVLVTLHEKALPYTFIPVDIAKGEQKSEDYKKLQPFAMVPVLEDDGFVMYESRAICRYLERCVIVCVAVVWGVRVKEMYMPMWGERKGKEEVC